LVCIGLQCSLIQLIHYKSKPPIVVIIKAAGFIEGQKQDGVDGITEATSFGRNVHVITESLQHELKELGVESEIVRFNDHRRIEEISKDTYVELLVFAGPAYSSQFPQQLKNVVPKLKEYIFREKIRCTSMTTCRFMDSGQWTVKSFNDELKALGITTTDGLIIHHEYEDKDWESKVKAFAEQLQKTLQDELSSM
jgi:flavodoxin